jgi:hypothetical protein
MALSHTQRPRARRDFVVTLYFPDVSGTLEPERPALCPWKAPGEGSCLLTEHHRRERKSGPCFPLVVLLCRRHGHAFTLYPPGHAPYQRRAVLRLGPDGRAALGEGEREAFGEYESTLFEAALWARAGRAGARESGADPPRLWWSTQGRHLRLAARLAGVAPDQDGRDRERLAETLAVDALLLHEQARRVETRPGYRSLGEAICQVLAALRGGALRARRLLSSGHFVGHWGEPLHWDPVRRSLVRSPFPPLASARPP